jgi:hypothetical protein
LVLQAPWLGHHAGKPLSQVMQRADGGGCAQIEDTNKTGGVGGK